MNRALLQNERSFAAEERTAAAEARVKKARAFFFPNISALGNYTRRAYESVRTVGDQEVTLQKRDALSAKATLYQTLLDLRAFPVYAQTRRDRDAIKLEASEERRQIALEAARAYLVTLSTSQVRAAAERRLELSKTSLDDARARFEAQIVSSNDVTRAELEFATAERELTTTKNAEAETRLNLGFLLDMDIERPLEIPEGTFGKTETDPGNAQTLVEQARKRRLDLAAREKRVEALRFYAREPLYRYFPALSLSGEYRYTNEAGLTGRDTSWFIGIDATWSLFDGFVRQSDRAERVAQANATDFDRKQQERKVDVEVRTALVSIENAQAGIRQALVAASTARRNSDETSELYRNGLSTALALADANQSLFEAEIALVRERLSFATAVLDLRTALGLDPFGKEPK